MTALLETLLFTPLMFVNMAPLILLVPIAVLALLAAWRLSESS